METILFAVGGSIREEGAQSDAEASLEHPDAAPPPANPKGRAHLRQYLRIKPRPGHQPGLRFLLDLDANVPRQNGSI